MANRVVVTGLGVVTPIGSGKDNFWQALLAGKIGIDRISRFDPEGFACQIAGRSGILTRPTTLIRRKPGIWTATPSLWWRPAIWP